MFGENYYILLFNNLLLQHVLTISPFFLQSILLYKYLHSLLQICSKFPIHLTAFIDNSIYYEALL